MNAHSSEPPKRTLRALVGGSLLAIFLIGPHRGLLSDAEANAAEPRALGVAVAEHVVPLPGLRLLPSTDAEHEQPSRAWRLIDGKHWQMVASGTPEPTVVTDAREKNRGTCAPGMVEVKGKMKTHPTFSIDGLQLQTCTKWVQKEWPERCGEYDRAKWLEQSKDYPTKDEHFCIDRFEYPNQKDAYPIVMVTWFEARDACKVQGKRLCTEEEWTFACEGEEAMPYPTGYTREADKCVFDEPWGMPKEGSLLPRDSDHARNEIDRIFHGAPSGSARSCKSAFGVYDMTGNIDEWTRSSIPGERPSILKGGYFGPVRTRCRPATRAHSEGHVYYQQGFRCCAGSN